jgi:hypothetical protein
MDERRATPRASPPGRTADVADRVRAICRALGGAVEHDAWTGVSWRTARGATFVHVVHIENAWPPLYATTFETDGPATVVTFQADPDERRALAEVGPPFFLPRWRPGIVGLVVGDDTDWAELAELIADSHRRCGGRQRA